MKIDKKTYTRWSKRAEKTPKVQKEFGENLMKEVLTEFILLYEESRGTNYELIKLWELAAYTVRQRLIDPMFKGNQNA